MVTQIDRFEVMRLRERGAQLVEVLPRSQYDKRHLAGAISIPLRQLGAEARDRLDPERPVVTYCYDSLCDMSPRAAARLQAMGFSEVYDYAPSKVDWFANSLPAEGSEAAKKTIADVAERDVPRCRPGERIGDVRQRIGDWDVCLAVDDDDVLLGLLRAEALGLEDDRRVEDVMQEGPLTHRPDVTVEEMTHQLHEKPEPRVLVTNADGTVVGVTDPSQVARAAKEHAGG